MPINHNTRSLLFGRPSKDASAIRLPEPSGKDVFQDVPGLDLKTIKEIIGGKVVRADIVTSVQRMASLNYLSSFLDLRGRLQELGAVFSPSSELVAYGDPASDKEFEEMLALGPMYEEQWNMFFVEYRNAELQDTADMWPDLRTLKKILSNNGIVFGVGHVRLNCGDASDSIVRLCEAYDDLRKQWLAMMQLHLPGNDDEELHDPENSYLSDVSELDDDPGSTSNTGELEQGDNLNFSSRNHRARSSGVPQNIGWRFSDDIEAKSEKMERHFRDKETTTITLEPAAGIDSRYRTTDEAFESQLWAAVGITLPLSRPCTPENSTQDPVSLQGSSPHLGFLSEQPSSSSRRSFNPSMTLLEALAMTPPGYDLQQNPSTLVDDSEKPIEFYRAEQKQSKTKWWL